MRYVDLSELLMELTGRHGIPFHFLWVYDLVVARVETAGSALLLLLPPVT